MTPSERPLQFTCVPAPIGCGRRVEPTVLRHGWNQLPPPFGIAFKDALSLKEYRRIGLCQTCQDTIFDAPDT